MEESLFTLVSIAYSVDPHDKPLTPPVSTQDSVVTTTVLSLKVPVLQPVVGSDQKTVNVLTTLTPGTGDTILTTPSPLSERRVSYDSFLLGRERGSYTLGPTFVKKRFSWEHEKSSTFSFVNGTYYETLRV